MDAAQLDEALIVATEAALMNLSEALAADYMGHSERTESQEETPA